METADKFVKETAETIRTQIPLRKQSPSFGDSASIVEYPIFAAPDFSASSVEPTEPILPVNSAKSAVSSYHQEFSNPASVLYLPFGYPIPMPFDPSFFASSSIPPPPPYQNFDDQMAMHSSEKRSFPQVLPRISEFDLPSQKSTTTTTITTVTTTSEPVRSNSIVTHAETQLESQQQTIQNSAVPSELQQRNTVAINREEQHSARQMLQQSQHATDEQRPQILPDISLGKQQMIQNSVPIELQRNTVTINREEQQSARQILQRNSESQQTTKTQKQNAFTLDPQVLPDTSSSSQAQALTMTLPLQINIVPAAVPQKLLVTQKPTNVEPPLPLPRDNPLVNDIVQCMPELLNDPAWSSLVSMLEQIKNR